MRRLGVFGVVVDADGTAGVASFRSARSATTSSKLAHERGGYSS